MARPESHLSSRRKLSLVGKKTYSVSIPVNEITRLGWKKGDDLVVRRYKDYIIVQKED